MSIASLVLRIRPATRPQAEAALHALPGVECHHMSDEGHLIVTVEDAEGAAMSDTLIAIHRIPEVLAATLAYEHSEQYEQPTQAEQSIPFASSVPSSPCQEPLS